MKMFDLMVKYADLKDSKISALKTVMDKHKQIRQNIQACLCLNILIHDRYKNSYNTSVLQKNIIINI